VPESSPRSFVAAAHRGLNRALAARFTLRAIAWCLAALALAVLAGAFVPLAPAGAWVRTLALSVAAVAAIAAMIARFRRESPSLETYLERVEQRFPAVRSWLRNALELDAPPPHASPELAQAVVRETTRRVADVPLAEMAPGLAPRRPGLAIGVAALTLAALALFVPARSARSWRTLADPNAAAPPVRLVVEPGSVKLSPGASLAVQVPFYILIAFVIAYGTGAMGPHVSRSTMLAGVLVGAVVMVPSLLIAAVWSDRYGRRGIYMAGGNLTVANCEFSFNLAASGAGMFNYSCNPTVINCSFHDNRGCNSSIPMGCSSDSQRRCVGAPGRAVWADTSPVITSTPIAMAKVTTETQLSLFAVSITVTDCNLPRTVSDPN
jgi:hypothetical protein